MTTELSSLKLKRAELQHQIAKLEGTRASLYTPGITLVPQEGPLPNEIDEQIEQLRAALIEIDTAINSTPINEIRLYTVGCRTGHLSFGLIAQKIGTNSH